MGHGSCDLVTVGTLDRGYHLALEYLEYGCADSVNHSDQQFVSVCWFSFRVADISQLVKRRKVKSLGISRYKVEFSITIEFSISSVIFHGPGCTGTPY